MTAFWPTFERPPTGERPTGPATLRRTVLRLAGCNWPIGHIARAVGLAIPVVVEVLRTRATPKEP